VPWSRKVWAFLKSDISLSPKRKRGEIKEARPEAASPEDEPTATQTVEKQALPEAARPEDEPTATQTVEKQASPEAARPEDEPTATQTVEKQASPEAASPEAEPRATQAVEKGPSKRRWGFRTRQKTSAQLQENVAKDTPRQKSSGKAKQQETAYASRQLWGQEFSIVEGGLEPKQVVQFVNNILARHRKQLSQQAQPEPMPRLLAKQVIAEAERDSTSLRQKAKQEAEVEVARQLAEARQKTQQMLEDAKKQAQEAAEEEADAILDTANQKAGLVETQSLQIAHLFLLKAREEVQRQIASETKEVYHRLLAPLQQLISAAELVDSEWSIKKIKPSWGELSELKDYQFTLLESLAAGRGDIQSLLTGEALQDMETQEGTVGEPAGALEGTAEEIQTDLKEQPETLEEEAPEALEETAPVETLEEAPSSELAGPPEEEVAETATSIESSSEAVPAKTQEGQPPRTVALPEEGFSETEVLPGGEIIYSGEVDVIVSPPVTAARVIALYNHLQEAVPDAKVLRTAGSWEGGTVVTIVLERPIPLVRLLSEIPGLRVTPGGSSQPIKKGLGGQGRPMGKITIAFLEQNGPSEAEGTQ